jgi:hypothetical protein
MEKSLADIVSQSRMEVINSQLRINIADLVVRALQSQGFVISEAGYENGDRGSNYNILLRNLEGNEIAVRVTPGNQNGVNLLELDSFDAELRTSHELNHRAREISTALSRFGLKMENPKVVDGRRSEHRYLIPEKINNPKKINLNNQGE